MRLQYPQLRAVTVDGLRLYEVPGGWFYPSITTVLGRTMPEHKAAALRGWRQALGEVADQRAKEAADHGTAVHLLVERFLKQEALTQAGDNIDPRSVAAFNALRPKLRAIDEVWGLEVTLYSDQLRLAGRCDCIATYKGVPSIIDFKTSGRIKGDELVEDYRLQLVAYAVMHNELLGTNIEQGVILMTSAGGFPQEFRVNLLGHLEGLIQRVDKFYATLNLGD